MTGFAANRAWRALFVPSGALGVLLVVVGSGVALAAAGAGEAGLASAVAVACLGATGWSVAYVFGFLALEVAASLERPSRAVLSLARRARAASP